MSAQRRRFLAGFRELGNAAKARVGALTFFVGCTEISYALSNRFHPWDMWWVYVWPVVALAFEYQFERLHVIHRSLSETCDQLIDNVDAYERMAVTWQHEVEVLEAEVKRGRD